MNELKLLLEAVQLIIRDRNWNNQNFEVQSKITDANISRILNPIQKPQLNDKTAEVFVEQKQSYSIERMRADDWE